MEIRKEQCHWCFKEYPQRIREIKKGILKGQKVIDNPYCSTLCERSRKQMLDCIAELENLEYLRNKMIQHNKLSKHKGGKNGNK